MKRLHRLRVFYWHWHVEIGLLVLFAGLAFTMAGLLQTRADVAREAKRGALAYRAECTYVAGVKRSIREAQRFLAMTPLEREEQLGVVLGSIPPATVRAQLANEQRAVQSLRGLGC